jgi:hypothetical protein
MYIKCLLISLHFERYFIDIGLQKFVRETKLNSNMFVPKSDNDLLK